MKKLTTILKCITAAAITMAISVPIAAHSGGTDSSGGHWRLDDDGGRIPGSYHYHNDGYGTGTGSASSQGIEPKYQLLLAVYGEWLPLNGLYIHSYNADGLQGHLLPAVVTLEAVGCSDFVWDGESKTLSFTAPSGSQISLITGDDNLYIDGGTVPLIAAPVIIDDRVYVSDEIIELCVDALVRYSDTSYEGHQYRYISVIEIPVYAEIGAYNIRDIRHKDTE